MIGSQNNFTPSRTELIPMDAIVYDLVSAIENDHDLSGTSSPVSVDPYVPVTIIIRRLSLVALVIGIFYSLQPISKWRYTWSCCAAYPNSRQPTHTSLTRHGETVLTSHHRYGCDTAYQNGVFSLWRRTSALMSDIFVSNFRCWLDEDIGMFAVAPIGG